jgi:hypothetical protein
LNYGRVPGVGKLVARIVRGTVMLRSDEEQRSSALLEEVFAIIGCNTGDEFLANVEAGSTGLTREEIVWLKSGETGALLAEEPVSSA